MDTHSFSDILLFVLSVCAVIMTSMLVIVAHFLLGAVRKAEDLIEIAQREMRMIAAKRRGIEMQGRTMLKIAKWFLAAFVLRRK